MRKEGKKNRLISKRIVYKILSIITVFLMIMGINIHPISAAENESYDYKYVDDYEFGDSKKAVIFQLKDESGEIYYAYCVDKDTRIQKIMITLELMWKIQITIVKVMQNK